VDEHVIADVMLLAGLVPYFGFIPVHISVFVHIPGEVIAQIDAEDAEVLQRVELVGFADAVVILVNPHAEVAVDRIAGVDDSVSVSAIGRVVEDRQGQVAVRVSGFWLGRSVAEQLGEVVDSPIAVPIQGQPSIVEGGFRLAHLMEVLSRQDAELNPVGYGGEMEADTGRIDRDWAADARPAAGLAYLVAVVAAGFRRSAQASRVAVRTRPLACAGVADRVGSHIARFQGTSKDPPQSRRPAPYRRCRWYLRMP
jgi:hypothetical protein